MVKILATNTPSLASAADPVEAIDYVEVTVTISAGSPTVDVTSVQFAIRTNNASGPEYVKSGDIHESTGTVMPVKASATSSDLVCYENTTTYQIQTRASAEAAWASSAGNFLHDADALELTHN